MTFTSPQCPLPPQQHDRELGPFIRHRPEYHLQLLQKAGTCQRRLPKTQEKGGTKAQWRAGYEERISQMSNLRQNESPSGTVLERRWSPPQAQKPQIG